MKTVLKIFVALLLVGLVIFGLAQAGYLGYDRDSKKIHSGQG